MKETTRSEGAPRNLSRGEEVAASLEVSVPSCLIESSGSKLGLSDWRAHFSVTVHRGKDPEFSMNSPINLKTNPMCAKVVEGLLCSVGSKQNASQHASQTPQQPSRAMLEHNGAVILAIRLKGRRD